MKADHHSDYDTSLTGRCEQALVTLIGGIGPWSERLVLVGGLVPRYIVGRLPPGAIYHVGTADVDLVIKLAVDESPEVYETLQRNMTKSGFVLGQPSYQWSCQVDGTTVRVEFLCDTDQVGAGRIHRPIQGAGSGFGAFNVPGARFAARDFVEVEVEANRIDQGGLSKVRIRVAGLLAYVVLKVLAFQDRHKRKDAYDLVYTLANFPDGGPSSAARIAAMSPVRHEPEALDALELLGDRFASADHDGPRAYADFLGDPDDLGGKAQLRNTAVLAVRQFLAFVNAE